MVEQFKYLLTVTANQNLIHEEFKRRKNLVNRLTPELCPSAKCCMWRIFTGILIFKALTGRRHYKLFGVKNLMIANIRYKCSSVQVCHSKIFIYVLRYTEL
jgi:hypothetical protein